MWKEIIQPQVLEQSDWNKRTGDGRKAEQEKKIIILYN